MNRKFGLIAFLMLIFATMLSGCSGSTFLASSWPGIALNNDMLYVTAGNTVHVLDTEFGDPDWSYPEKPEAKTMFFAPAVFDGENMILSGFDNQLHVTSADDMRSDEWTFEAKNRFIDSALVADGMIFAANADHFLYALDMDGDEVFSFEADSPLWATPVYNDGVIYQVSQGGVLYALDAKEGYEIWQLDLDISVMSSPAINEDGMLFLSTMGSGVVAVDSNSGAIVWENEMDTWAWASPFYYEGFVYVGDAEGDFYAFDAETGNLSWTVKLSARVLSEPVVMGDAMYIGNEEGEIYAISFDGDADKLKEVDGKILSTGVTDGSLIFFAIVESEEDILAIGVDDTGSLEWEYVPEN